MKSVKIYGLAALAALAALMCVGASPAMAESTALCEFDTANFEEVCPEGHRVTHVHEATLAEAKADILNTILNIECDVLFLGDTVTPLRAPLLINGEYTYTNCNNGCTVTEENKPSVIKLLKTGQEVGEVTLEFLIHVNCMFMNCRFKAEAMPGAYWGPLFASEENGEISFQEVLPKESGILCPKESFLDLTTTPLDPVYIAK